MTVTTGNCRVPEEKMEPSIKNGVTGYGEIKTSSSVSN